jgi:hypothetical protein
MQAPHKALPHPYLVPVNPAMSRIAHNSGIWGSASSDMALPFKVISMAMGILVMVSYLGV